MKTVCNVSRLHAGQRWTAWTDVGEALSTSNMLALVRLLASMCSDVDSQSTALNKALAATRRCASVRPLICVNSVVSLQV